MPTFMDRRRDHLREVLAEYGGDQDRADYFLGLWIKGRLTQKEIELIVAADHGATSEELAEQFGFANSTISRGALTKATDQAGLPRFPSSSYRRD